MSDATPARAAAISRVLQAGGLRRSTEYRISAGLWGDTEGFWASPAADDEIRVEYLPASYADEPERVAREGLARCEAVLRERGYPVARRVVPVAEPGGWGEGERLFVGVRS